MGEFNNWDLEQMEIEVSSREGYKLFTYERQVLAGYKYRY